MAPSIGLMVLGCSFVAACGGQLQVGLVNTPWIGGDTPETRVHDVIANGRDACEVGGRQGEVLRGHVPPCGVEEKATAPVLFSRAQPPVSTPTPWHGFGVCMSEGAGFTRAEVTLPGFTTVADLSCEGPY